MSARPAAATQIQKSRTEQVLHKSCGCIEYKQIHETDRYNDDVKLQIAEMAADSGSDYELKRSQHIKKLIRALTTKLPKSYEKLTPSQTWLVYWITHSLALLDQQRYLESVRDDVIEFMNECAHERGGYGGGPGQIAHLANTYAAVNALITLGSEDALESIDRSQILRFFHRMKQPEGCFIMHDDGECDSRATYCAISVLRCLNIQDPILLDKCGDWIVSCQSYDGGFGSLPGAESHGGYTFCCVASLCLLNELHRIDIDALARWLTNRQLSEEGGFNGRPNKLVDSCYSFWQGAIFPLIHEALKKQLPEELIPTLQRTRSKTNLNSQLLDEWMFDSERIQRYILGSCQSDGGMLKDKPGVEPDFYHTCYSLAGLSISQHHPDDLIKSIESEEANLIKPTHPIFNVTPENLRICAEHFMDKRLVTYKSAEDEPTPSTSNLN